MMMNNERYVFSGTTGAFYPLSRKQGYVDAGSWPDDGVEVKEDIFMKFQNPPPGKLRGGDANGYPCWVDTPPPTLEDERRSAALTKKSQLDEAGRIIGPLQDAVDLGMTTNTEKASLLTWKKYRMLLNRVDISTAPDKLADAAQRGKGGGLMPVIEQGKPAHHRKGPSTF
ncbi:tail fiber assembly protein [Sodalis glossinidius]|nr:tail fiber assembly protein [Sodalis glossinidius]